ncbi:MAG: Gfo/Idh/MocA family oxidoreductase [Spirochaetes bacterium]|nr:Gfo/Idh/MocA family oxidoreductase [Spirochaetota bacterium]
MEKLNFGVIGLGIIGLKHLNYLKEISSANIYAVCSRVKEKIDETAKLYKCKPYYSYQELLNDKNIDAVIITTPHDSHAEICIEAFKKNKHVLCEKPLAVDVFDAEKIIDKYNECLKNNSELKFSIVFQQRTFGCWKKIKEILNDNLLGKLIRATWIITNKFRTQYYFNSANWRAKWSTEGGGVLLNQVSHELDIYQWLLGMPDKIRAFCSFGKYHEIEVEDEVTIYFTYKNDLIGHFIASTGEAPGTNRLEITGENGKLVYEHDKINLSKNKIKVFKNKISSLNFIKDSKEMFGKPEYEIIDIQFPLDNNDHKAVIENFTNAVLNKEKLYIDGRDGINSLYLSNGAVLSQLENETIDIPFKSSRYRSWLNKLKKA